ncbi:GNAT family N-acetyltransferase [Pendulispora brunnea]|uniref:GNAT family N-acetyltransferase n=1 Tax=Pendulispora brunnea TaxID=2905690 RepID=A0ABZ2JZ57_9BACT
MTAPILIDLPEAIETKRLYIRAPMPGDGSTTLASVLETWDALHETMPWARERPTLEGQEAAARRLHAAFVRREDLPMFAFLKDRKTHVACSGLHRMDWDVPRFEIGYWVRRSFEGQGYVTEVVRALAGFALAKLGAQRVEIRCSHRNVRSQRVAERCGFTLEARLRNEARETNGELRDTLVYSLLPGDSAAASL